MKYIQFKGLFRDLPIWGQITIVVFLLLFSSLTLLLIGEFLLSLISTENSALTLEITQLSSALGMFIIAPLCIAYLFSFHPKEFLVLRSPQSTLLILAIITTLASIPFVNYITSLNEMMHLPAFLSGVEEWMREMEDKNTSLTFKMLSDHSFAAILLDVLVLAIIPAIGEELLFRGVIQRGLEKKLNNSHIAIWITAFLFSAIHLQFFGFFPRLIMGAIFGYMLYLGKSIWLPICCHFTNNILVIITSHLYPQETERCYLDTIGKENLTEGIISLLLFSLFFYLFKQMSEKTT